MHSQKSGENNSEPIESPAASDSQEPASDAETIRQMKAALQARDAASRDLEESQGPNEMITCLKTNQAGGGYHFCLPKMLWAVSGTVPGSQGQETLETSCIGAWEQSKANFLEKKKMMMMIALVVLAMDTSPIGR